MDAYPTLKSLCQSRHSSRRFLDAPVPQDLIDKILDIARTSPFAGGSKSWEVVVVREPDRIEVLARAVRVRINELHDAIRPEFRSAFLDYSVNFTAFERAPVVMLPVVRIIPTLTIMLPEPSHHIARMEEENFVKSISCVAMLILLAAQSLGLASCLATGPLIAEDEIGRIIGLKTGRRIGAVIPIGYEDHHPS